MSFSGKPVCQLFRDMRLEFSTKLRRIPRFRPWPSTGARMTAVQDSAPAARRVGDALAVYLRAARAHRDVPRLLRPGCRSRCPARRCWCGCARPASISAPSACSRWSARRYTIKFLWAPLVDALDVPVLSRWLGRRRGWLVFAQLLLMAATVFLAFYDPGEVALAGRTRRAARRGLLRHAGHRDRCIPGRDAAAE